MEELLICVLCEVAGKIFCDFRRGLRLYLDNLRDKRECLLSQAIRCEKLMPAT